jgi:hypothetical protein
MTQELIDKYFLANLTDGGPDDAARAHMCTETSAIQKTL